MEQVVMLVTIIDQNRAARFRSYYTEQGVQAIFSTAGVGTASSDTLDYLGLGQAEKSVLFSLLTEEAARRLVKALNNKMRLYIPGHGIAFSVALSSFAGALALKYLTGAGEEQEGAAVEIESEKNGMENENESSYELIVAIANRGYSDRVMDAARAAHARGGTVIHATGTGSDQAESFFGVNLNPEKDMLFIVATRQSKNEIMKAIVAQVGVSTEAHAIVFSLPVSDLAGIRIEE